MSEQTPTSTEDLNGAEPSMEDILASIRKIISEDEPVALESPEDVPSVGIVEAEAPLSSFGEGPTDAASDLAPAEGESVDLNIDDVLAGLEDEGLETSESFSVEDLEIPEIPDDASEDFSVESLMSELDTVADEQVIADAVSETGLEADAAALENDEDVFSFLDTGAAGVVGAAGAATAVVAGAAGSFATEGASEDVAAELSDLIEAVDSESSAAEIVSDDIEMDALLDDILLSPEEVEEVVPVEASEDVLEDLIEDHVLDEAIALDDVEGFASEDVMDEMALETEELLEAEQSDLDLVKSLMAELADDPSIYDEGEDLDALLDVEDTEGDIADDILDEAAEVELDVAEMPDADTQDLDLDMIDDAGEDDILGEILDMTLEDELQGQPDDLELGDLDLGDLASLDDVAAAEQENILENILEEASIDESATDLPSLAEIAAAAEADAMAVETSAAPVAGTVGLVAAGAGLAALGAKVADEAESEPELEVAEIETAETQITEFETIDAAEIETAAVETPIETETNPLPTQETSMPVKAVKTDTIIDEVTESATAGAFAELNQVVEDKAVFNERGPRIGDLVQDALRPMLKEWLDANLKGIVERAVTKEVKRISKGN